MEISKPKTQTEEPDELELLVTALVTDSKRLVELYRERHPYNPQGEHLSRSVARLKFALSMLVRRVL
jgi:hypothetical protein